MSNQETVNPKSPLEPAKPKFSSYLRAVSPDRMSVPANNQDKDKPLILVRQVTPPSGNLNVQLLQATGVLVSAIWLAGAAFYVQRTVGWSNVSSLMPHELGGFLAGILTPIALFWMIAAFIMRSIDVKMYAETLREEIQNMIFPSEEADRRVNNDIERLMRQTAEMSKATKYALTALDAAREAMKGQVQALNTGSEDTLDRLTNLSLNLQERTKDVFSMRDQLDETLSTLDGRAGVAGDIVQKLAQATDIVQQQTKAVDAATGNTELAVARLSAMLRERLESLGSLHGETEKALQAAAEELKKQRQELRVEAENIEEKSYSVAEALTKGTEKLYAYTDDALDKAKLIETRLQGQTMSIEHVLSQATRAVEQIETTTTNATEQLAEASSRTAQDAHRIEAVIQTAIDRLQEKSTSVVQEAQQGAADFTGRLLTGVTQIEQQTKIAAQQTQSVLNDLSDRIAEGIAKATTQATVSVQQTQDALNSFTDGVAQQLANTTAQAAQSVQSTKDQLLALTGTIVDNISQVDERAKFAVHQAQTGMSEATNRFVTEVDSVSERAKGITNDMLNEVNRKVSDTTAAFVYIQKQIQSLVTLFDQRKDHLDEAGAGARATADALQKTLQGALDKVYDTTKALQLGIGSIQKAVQEPIGQLEDAANMAARKAVDITNLIDSKAVVLTDAAHKIGQDVTTLHDQLHGKGQDVALLAGKIATHLKTVTDQIDTQNTVLTGNVQQSIQSANELADIQKQITDGLMGMQVQTQTVTDRIQALQQGHNALSEDVQNAEGRLSTMSERLNAIANAAVEKIKKTLEDMTLLEADYHRLSEASIKDIQKIEQGYRVSLQKVEAQTDEAVGKLSVAYQGMHDKTVASQQQLQAQAGTIDSISETLQGLSHTVGNTIDTVLTKAAKVQDVGQYVQLTLQKISDTTMEFDNQVERSKEYVSIHARSLQDSIGQIEEKARQAVGAFVQQGKTLQDQAQDQLANISLSVDKTAAVTDHLRKYLDHIRTQSQDVEQSVQQSVERLTSHSDTIDAKTTHLIDRIGQAHQTLVEQSQEVATYGDDLLQRLAEATAIISSKTGALEKASTVAQQQAEALRGQDNRLKRDAFFNSTKFVVESLHSLALDFTRLLDGELPEKTWAAYQKGDAASFTRRLLSSRNEETQTKIQNKFKDDTEFRTYVQRYLRQFEEMYDQAETNDHADLLTSIFLSSDVGKLYTFLSSVLERDARGSNNRKIAV